MSKNLRAPPEHPQIFFGRGTARSSREHSPSFDVAYGKHRGSDFFPAKDKQAPLLVSFICCWLAGSRLRRTYISPQLRAANAAP